MRPWKPKDIESPPPVDGPVNCWECRLGRALLDDYGCVCPQLTRTLEPGDALYEKGQVAEQTWFVKAGVLATDEGDRVHLTGPNHFVGAESDNGGTYHGTARAITTARVCWAPPWAAQASNPYRVR